MSNDYEVGLCDFGGECCMGCCCPCLLMQKTHHQLQHARKSDKSPSYKPIPEKELDKCGGVCCGWYMLNMFGGWGGVLGFIQRRDIREHYGMEESTCGDLVKSFCCPCCSVIQQYKEVEKRSHKKGTGVVKQGYQSESMPNFARA